MNNLHQEKGGEVERLAPVQCDRPPEEDSLGGENIWYSNKKRKRPPPRGVASSTRCVPDKHEGRTRCSRGSYICLHFAQGSCHLGHKCTRRHRVPKYADEMELDVQRDIFGRERQATEGDDQNGPGSIMKENKTLFVGNVGSTCTEAMLNNAFGALGPIVSVRLFTAKDLAFVQFRWRASAEFAKEAMSQQTLDNGNIVSVRWAREDPNPRAVAAAAAERAHYAARAVAEAVSFTSRETQLPATSSYGGTGTIGDEKLPSGWTAYFHAVYQRPYYVHVSGITQWEYPVAASALVVADNQIRETEAVSASHSSRDVDTRDENPLALLAAYASSDEDVAEKRHEQKKDAKSTQALQNDGNGESVGSSDDSKRRKVSLESSS